MVMPENIASLQSRLTQIRDAALRVFDAAEAICNKAYPVGGFERQYGRAPGVWTVVPETTQARADELRRELRIIMVRITDTLRDSPLVTEADVRDLARHTKTMVAALRFRRFQQWGVYVHHDEDRVLGVDPPSQSESDLSDPAQARELFADSYRSVIELMDLWTPRLHRSSATAVDGQLGTTAYRLNTAFIMMWINPQNPELADVRDTVKEVFKTFGIQATRADEIEHEGVITARIIQEIAESEFLFADLSGERPSVYYEVGYAHAIGKRVILYRKKGTAIHFDLAAHNCPEYENMGELRRRLTSRLAAMTNRGQQAPASD